MKSENMIAITGANGYIGRELVKALERENLNYSLLKRTNHGLDADPDSRCRIVIGELSDKAALKKLLHNCSCVVNLAGEYQNDKAMYDTNYIGLKNLFEVSCELSIPHFIQLSSVGVYGRPREGIIHEDHPFTALNIYEQTKILAEKYLINQNSSNMKITILRPSNIFSPKMKNQHLKQMFLHINKGLFFFIGKDNAKVNYIFLDNLIYAIISIIKKKKIKAGIDAFNLNQSDSLVNFVNYLTLNKSKNRKYFRLPYIFARLLAYISDITSKISKYNIPLTTDRVKALSSSAEFSQKKFDEHYKLQYNYSLQDAIKQCTDEWDRLN